MLKIDCHMHMLSPHGAQLYKQLTGKNTFNYNPVEEYTAQKLTKLLDAAGLTHGFALSSAYLFAPGLLQKTDEVEKVTRENDYVLEQCNMSRGRLIPFFSVNPLRNYAVDEIFRCSQHAFKKGLKLHFANPSINIEDDFHLESLKKIFNTAAELDIPLLIHLRGKRYKFGSQQCRLFFSELVEKIPVRVIIAHLGGWGGFDDATEEISETIQDLLNTLPDKTADRVFLDISSVIVTKKEVMVGILHETDEIKNEKIRNLLKKLGLNRILYGSDWPYISPFKYLENLRNVLKLSEDEIETILINDPFKGN